jgi:2-amino-4-hydroxy-6-hydroxymethyldihydropteridine diphosphokinase
MAATSYLIGLGSNRRHGRHGAPARTIAAAIAAIEGKGIKVKAVSPTLRTPALGPSDRDFANAAALIKTRLDPPELLARLKAIERRFGRRPGRRWAARVLDLDILAWSAGAWPRGPRRAAPGRLAIPHPALAVRRFALAPAAALGPGWRHPHLGVTLRQLEARRGKTRPVDRHAPAQ